MTIAFDDQLNFWSGTGNITDANTPIGTLAGVLALITHDFDTDLVTSVTYGGTALTRVRSNADSSGSLLFRTYCYFLGSSVPAGTQDLVVTRTGSQNLIGQTIGLTGATDLEVVDHDGIDGDTETPSVTLQYGGRTSLAFAIVARTGTEANVTSLAGQTNMLRLDQGSWCVVIDRQTTPGTSDFTIGYTCAPGTNDSAFSAIALSEVAAPPPGGTIGRLVNGGLVNGGFVR